MTVHELMIYLGKNNVRTNEVEQVEKYKPFNISWDNWSCQNFVFYCVAKQCQNMILLSLQRVFFYERYKTKTRLIFLKMFLTFLLHPLKQTACRPDCHSKKTHQCWVAIRPTHTLLGISCIVALCKAETTQDPHSPTGGRSSWKF